MPDHILGRKGGDTVVFETVGAACQNVRSVTRWVYILPIDADGRGTNELQLACLVFSLDLDDLNVSGDTFLGHDFAQAPKCKIMRRTLVIVKEAHSHEV
jgi:hypothetical protein